VKKGKFIVFEGLDGSGKSTQIQMLSKHLHDLNLDVYETAEPTNGPIGRLIRQMLSGELKSDQRILACLFAADRTDHLINQSCGIKNKVDSGALLLCDRYYFSSYAYHARDMDMEWLIRLNLPNAEIMRPDLTIFIDVPPAKCFDRIKQSRYHIEIFEQLDILKQVRENYFKAFDILKNKEKVIIIDGNDDMEIVGKKILKGLEKVLAQR
jgi:dTMP kinase